ncbi:MAG: hypothetical protein A2849_02155 [Candidatus Taylorbacteria bacterium RIFCSPHIGHO2_01_FULL_51_15]|uniref:Uncharacterized protein n=1 Tax=Candidatus Taylorbacteria bacterium RIFCSPHIGHO2_01_FULL_51_15 TaxID=1802304 RepID=A0A1G2MF98_9BACT|nr:MAG: hypothetical protein A2849_02155 [Candidatus Taylorbacteria bacterium RIFCSPHIGHO2_01_FULL_51_15]
MIFDKKLPVFDGLFRGGILTKAFLQTFPPFFRNSRRKWTYYGVLLLSLLLGAGFVQNRTWSLAHRSALEATFLATEAHSEVGPGFKLAAEAHLHLLNLYRERLERRLALKFAWFTLPLHAPDRNLKSAIDALTNAANSGDEAAARRAIKHDTVKALSSYAERLERMSAIRYKGYPVGACSTQDERTLRGYLGEFNTTFTNLLRNPTPATAEEACFQSRIATGAFILIGPEFVKKNGLDELNSFVAKLEVLSTEMAELAAAAKLAQRNEEYERLDHYAKNVSRRAITLLDHIKEKSGAG